MSGFSGGSEWTIHRARAEATEGCRKYLAAIIRVAVKNDSTPPGLSVADTKRLYRELKISAQQAPYVRKSEGKSATSVRRREPTPIWASALPAFQEVAEKHGLTVADLTGPSRHAKIIEARREVCARLHGKYSLALIGRWMGNRDHSTIIAYLKKAA